MKRFLSVIICVLSMISLCACGGNVSDVKIHSVDSKIYLQEDITSAINVIKSEFKKEWSGCTLTEIYYAGDECSYEHKEFADRNNADEVLVLLSSFDVDSSGGDGSLNSNSTYDDWKWILVRSDGGKWKHVDHGY